jgi:hypothetical protein
LRYPVSRQVVSGDPCGSHTWLHRRVPLTSAFANCLTTAAPQFVSRNASIPTAAPVTHRNDLGLRGSRAEDDIGREKMQSNVGRHIRRSHRWPPLCTAQRAGSGIGANLARMEIKLIFNELADQIPDIAKLAEPQRLRSAGSTASRSPAGLLPRLTYPLFRRAHPRLVRFGARQRRRGHRADTRRRRHGHRRPRRALLHRRRRPRARRDPPNRLSVLPQHRRAARCGRRSRCKRLSRPVGRFGHIDLTTVELDQLTEVIARNHGVSGPSTTGHTSSVASRMLGPTPADRKLFLCRGGICRPSDYRTISWP